MTTVSDVSVKQNQYQVATMSGNLNQIGNVLAGSNNVSQTVQPSEVKQTKKFREDYINKNIISEYKLNKDEVYQFLNNIGYSEDKLFNVNDEEFKQIISLLTAVAEFIIRPSEEGNLSERYKSAVNKIQELRNQNLSIKEITNNIEEFGADDVGLYEYIKTKCHDELKNYKSIDEIPEELLIKCINNVINELKNKNNDSGNNARSVGNSMQIFNSLLLKTKDENIKILWNAFVKSESSKNIALSVINSLNKYEKKEELAKFIDGLSDNTLTALGVNREDLNIIRIAKTGKMNDEQIAAVTNRAIEIISNIINNNPQLIKVLNKFIEAKKNNTEVSLTPEEQAVYDKNRDAIDELCGYNLGVANNDVASEQAKQNHFDSVNPKLKEAGIIEYFYNEYKSIIDSNPELFAKKSTDEIIQNIDKYTNGEFLKSVCSDEKSECNNNASTSSSFGLEQKTTSDEYIAMAASAEEKIQSLYQDENAENHFIVEKNSDKYENTSDSPVQKFNLLSTLSGTELMEGISKKYVKFSDVLNKYNDLTQSGKEFINNLIESMSKSVQNYVLNGLKGSVIMSIAQHTNIDFSKLKIEGLSIDNQNLLSKIMENKKGSKFASV